MTLYARAITLRNCGRFTVIASDFGGDYRTHTHITSQALYASLTRGATWRAGGAVDGRTVYPYIRVRKDHYDFAADYDLQAFPLWFTPGLFVRRDGDTLSDQALDAGYFNVVHECYPSTSRQFKLDNKGKLKETKRPSRVPTYGTWQGILPDRQLHTIALACDPALLEAFAVGQTYLLGKKRTMMQITLLSEVVPGEERCGVCQTALLQLVPEEITLFQSFEVLAATMRYIILRGVMREKIEYVEFPFSDRPVCLPDVYLKQTPLPFAHT
jgi:hypothetical protein